MNKKLYKVTENTLSTPDFYDQILRRLISQNSIHTRYEMIHMILQMITNYL